LLGRFWGRFFGSDVRAGEMVVRLFVEDKLIGFLRVCREPMNLLCSP
jgi:hypothetical protein